MRSPGAAFLPVPRVAIAVLVAVGTACAAAEPKTEIGVLITSDLDVPSDIDRIEISVTGTRVSAPRTVMLMTSGPRPPITIGLVPMTDTSGPVSISVLAYRMSAVRVRADVRTRFLARRSILLTIPLRRVCADQQSCSFGMSCGDDGRCVDSFVDPAMLPRYMPSPSDAGMIDVPTRPDASIDGPVMDAPREATIDSLLDTSTDDASANPPDTLPDQTNPIDAQRPDGACACDDGNPCTRDSCDADGGCTRTPLPMGTDCDDGLACNGVGRCNGAGSCQSVATGCAPIFCGVGRCVEPMGTCAYDLQTGECDSDPCTVSACVRLALCDSAPLCPTTHCCRGGMCFAAAAPECS